jgi:hypothetical protein
MIDHGIKNSQIGFPGNAKRLAGPKPDKTVHQQLSAGPDTIICHLWTILPGAIPPGASACQNSRNGIGKRFMPAARQPGNIDPAVPNHIHAMIGAQRFNL